MSYTIDQAQAALNQLNAEMDNGHCDQRGCQLGYILEQIINAMRRDETSVPIEDILPTLCPEPTNE